MNEKQFLIDMGGRIAKRRKSLKLTQEKTAEKMGVSLQMISCVELGKKAIRPENLVKLCRTLNVSADYILFGEKDEKQLEGITKKISSLDDDDLEMVESLIDYFNNKKANI